jgi:hypothetical protein
MHAFVPRFSPLGTDTDGNTYWALTPGHYERDDAYNLIEDQPSASAKQSKAKRRHTPDENDRPKLKDWSWFVVARGKRPADSILASDAEEEDEQDADGEAWWAFWEPEEIRKLAHYIEIKAGLDDDESEAGESASANDHSSPSSTGKAKETVMAASGQPSKGAMRGLVQSLYEYGSLLAWRTRTDSDSPSGKGKAT